MKMGMFRGRRSDTPLSTRQLGFTLFEVILVLAIVAVLTAVILSRNSPAVARAKLQGQAELLKTQLRYAQARALNADQVWGMTASNNQVWLFNDGSTSNQVTLPGEAGTPVIFGIGDRAGLSVPDFIVSFDDHGQPHMNDAGTSLAGAAVAVAVTDGTTTIQIDITPNTGFIQ